MTPRDSVLRDYAHETFDATQFGVDAAFDRGLGRLAVLVDDAEIVAESPAAAVLDRLTRTARDSGHLVVIAGNDGRVVGRLSRLRGRRAARRAPACCSRPAAPSMVKSSACGYRERPASQFQSDAPADRPGRGNAVTDRAADPDRTTRSSAPDGHRQGAERWAAL